MTPKEKDAESRQRLERLQAEIKATGENLALLRQRQAELDQELGPIFPRLSRLLAWLRK